FASAAIPPRDLIGPRLLGILGSLDAIEQAERGLVGGEEEAARRAKELAPPKPVSVGKGEKQAFAGVVQPKDLALVVLGAERGGEKPAAWRPAQLVDFAERAEIADSSGRCHGSQRVPRPGWLRVRADEGDSGARGIGLH